MVYVLQILKKKIYFSRIQLIKNAMRAIKPHMVSVAQRNLIHAVWLTPKVIYNLNKRKKPIFHQLAQETFNII